MDILYESVKVFGELIGVAATAIKILGDRQAKQNEKINKRIDEVEKEAVRMIENVGRLREKIEDERVDFKERLKEITDYMYNRPR